MEFQLDQKVVCLSNESWCWLPIEPGEVYTIKAKYKCPCGSDQLILEESFYKINMICECGLSVYRYQSFYEWRFRPYVVS
jgi:hypothetical protein